MDLSINQVYRAKRKAREFILGDERLQYRKLREYAEMIRVINVGSKVILQIEIIEPNTQPKIQCIESWILGGGGGVQATCRIIWLPFEGQVWWTYIISNYKGWE